MSERELMEELRVELCVEMRSEWGRRLRDWIDAAAAVEEIVRRGKRPEVSQVEAVRQAARDERAAYRAYRAAAER